MSNEFYSFQCPHCDLFLVVYHSELNCRIFRHGVYKHDMSQVNPHLDKVSCDKLREEDKIYGCGKPFRVNSLNQIEICGYI